jgi:alpha-D-xyloside xylohydrolase
MRMKNRMTELAGDMVPVFADPDRDYCYLSRVRRYRRVEGGARFSVLTNDDEEVTLDIRFLSPHVVRVRCYRPGAEPPLDSPMLVAGALRHAKVDVEAREGRIVIRSDALELRVVRRPFHYGVFDFSEKKLFVQQIGDVSFLDLVALPMGYSRDAKGRIAFHESFELQPDERLFGLGQQYGALDKRGQRVVAWSRDAMGTNTTNVTYHHTPFFWSDRGYGLFAHHSSKITWELGNPSTITGSFRVDDPYLDYFLVFGDSPKDILARYGDLTGCAPVPPLWSFGVWLSRCMYVNRDEVEGVVEKARGLGLPFDVVHLDPRWLQGRKEHKRDACHFTWDNDAFPDEKGFVRWLDERGVRLSLWENPYVWNDVDMYREGVAKGYFALGPDRRPAPSLENPEEPENVVVDFTDPKAARWWQDKHRPHLRKGVAVFKTDYAEGVPVDALFSDGRGGRQVHNLYPLLYSRAVFDVTKEERGEGIVWARSGWAGSQRYPVHWVGDTQSTYGGMAGALRAGLSLSASGVPFWSHDIGGFVNPAGFGRPPSTLYVRWAQWGLLSSHSRFHGFREREPWFYGDDAVRIVRDFARLRYRLLPYLWACAREASASLMPVCRPMCLEFPDDPLAAGLDTQYMLGPSLLLAPVFNDEGRCSVYLPPGCWYDFWSGSAFEGGRCLDVVVPLERMPIYVRGDSILPFAGDRDYVDQKPWHNLRLDVRVEKRAALSIPPPIGPLDVTARRTGSDVRLNLRGSGQRLEVRLLAPSTVRDAIFTGDGENARWRRTRRGAVVEMTLRGRARIDVTA